VGDHLGVYRHAYTHFRVTLHAFCCTMPNGHSPRPIQVGDLRWVRLSELPEFPMGKIDRQISQDLLTREGLPCLS
jgi:A/G-specific adenine glycosylase